MKSLFVDFDMLLNSYCRTAAILKRGTDVLIAKAKEKQIPIMEESERNLEMADLVLSVFSKIVLALNSTIALSPWLGGPPALSKIFLFERLGGVPPIYRQVAFPSASRTILNVDTGAFDTNESFLVADCVFGEETDVVPLLDHSPSCQDQHPPPVRHLSNEMRSHWTRQRTRSSN